MGGVDYFVVGVDILMKITLLYVLYEIHIVKRQQRAIKELMNGVRRNEHEKVNTNESH